MTRALLIVDHGSRLPEAGAHLERVAAAVRAQAPGWIVRVAHMELADPGVAEGIDACVREGAREVTVHPFFLAPGRHLTRDIPALVAAAAKRHPEVRVRLDRATGELPGLPELIARSLLREEDGGRGESA
jgi:sirohydrochlorin ferrochelatase